MLVQRITHRFGCFAIVLVLAGCATSELVPSEMEKRIARNVSFQALQAGSDALKGQWMVLGGQVLNAKRLKDNTQIEILQLPLDVLDRPMPELTRSQGRFLVTQQEFLDPAILPAGTFVSVVGEVLGGKTLPLDETHYTYPLLRIEIIKVWEVTRAYAYPYRGPWPYPYGPMPYPFWRDPYWGPYPFWWP